MSSAISIGVGVASLAVAGAGLAMQAQGAADAKNAANGAAALNATQQKAQAKATAAVQRFQARLNYASAMSQAKVQDNNAIVLGQQARSAEKLGFEGISRLRMAQDAQQSSYGAAYGASGVTSDSGSPVIVEAYNAGMNQLARMDAAYKTNLEVGSFDWDSQMQKYQAELTRENAKQYIYAEQMADWTEQTGIIAANASEMSARSVASANYTSAVGNMATNASSIGLNAAQLYYTARTATPAGRQ